MYFCADDSFDVGRVRAFLRRLRDIESWFTAQSSYRFIASSLLFVYSGDAVRRPPPVTDGLSSTNCCSSADVETLTDGASEMSNGCDAAADGAAELWWNEHINVKMIDFTHAFEVSSPDDNYLTGLCSMIGYLSRLRAGMYAPDL